MITERELQTKSPLNWLLHDAMTSADNIFHALLVQEYGRHAGDWRYAYHHEREDINVAARQFVALCHAWIIYYRGWTDSLGL